MRLADLEDIDYEPYDQQIHELRDLFNSFAEGLDIAEIDDLDAAHAADAFRYVLEPRSKALNELSDKHDELSEKTSSCFTAYLKTIPSPGSIPDSRLRKVYTSDEMTNVLDQTCETAIRAIKITYLYIFFTDG